MRRVRNALAGLRALFFKRERNQEIDWELQEFFAQSVEDKMQRGMSSEEAFRQARIEIGSRDAVNHKVWSAGWEAHAERLWTDLTFTLRRLRSMPGSVAVVALSIGLGIGANATIFSIINKFVLTTAPVGEPQTLVAIQRTYDNGSCCNNFPMPYYLDVREQAKSFSGLAAYFEMVSASIGGGAEPERVWGQAATENFFDVIQLRMAAGRGFLRDEEHAPVVVLGYTLWQRRFHGDPAVIGRAITLGEQMYTVVGVAPQGFRGIDLILDPQFWVPLGTVSKLTATSPSPDSREIQWLRMVGRLRPGVSKQEAAAELDVLGQRLAAAHPATDKGNGFLLERTGALPARDRKALELFLAALFAVVLLVLCIACANVANLLLALGAKRQREMAVRLSLGASRRQLLRQMLLESTLLALLGGLAGAFLSIAATRGLSSYHLPVPVPLDIAVGFDWRVALFTFGLSMAAGILCGVVPAWRASRPVMPNGLKGEDQLVSHGRRFSLRNTLVVAQITLSFILLCVAGLFLRSLQSAGRIDVGFRSRGVLITRIDPPMRTYPPARMRQLLRSVRERIRVLPGVMSVTTTDGIPLSMGHRSDGFTADNKPNGHDAPIVEMYMAGPDYFTTMGIPRLAGREFGYEDPLAPKVAIVNEELARRLFPNEEPMGRHIVDGGVPYEIVGVVKNTKSRSIGEQQRPIMYRSIDQALDKDPSEDGYQFMVRYEGDPAPLAESVRRAIHSEDASLAVFNTQTMQEHLRDALFLPRLAGTLFGVFGMVGLLLASIGLYGVMSYLVSQRTKEIGVRIAMGAESGAVQGLFVQGGLSMVLVSLAIGLPLAALAAKAATSMLYGIHPFDAATFCTVPLVLLVVSLFACWIPARRASRVDPMVALRVD